MGLRFEWDPEKAKSNFNKHRVSFLEAATVFGDPLAGLSDDLDHSIVDERFIIIGNSQKLRTLVVVSTERDDTIRIISARLATKKERKRYEEKRRAKG